ncbi:nucleotidyltransferase domain-containing protein [Paenibacillus phytohabitans]|uniref:nucleotidyltransferase domain-containing protein n=1 Tax=Paenibacillus phytohabitans TaxID=2654978 RepID=UPI00300A5C1A
MRTDISNWKPLTVSEINKLFSVIPIHWCIAGGWALDLHLHKQTREHSDIDVIITREEQLIAYQYLMRDWMLYRAEDGKLSLWEDGEYLNSTNDVWVSKSDDSPWAFQLMIIDTEENSWTYKRDKSIRRPMAEIILKTVEGIPYLRPEIQLLHKAGGSKVREKDINDFRTMLPTLLPQEKAWLKSSLTRQFPEDHDWDKFL